MALNYFRSDGWVKNTLGPAVPGAQVYVLTQPANVVAPVTPPRTTPVPFVPNPQALIYSDAGNTPITQPILTDGFGHYDFYVLPGLYTVAVYYNNQLQQYYVDQSIGNVGSSSGSSIVFETNGTPNFNQLLQNLQQGSGIVLVTDNLGNTVISSTGSGVVSLFTKTYYTSTTRSLNTVYQNTSSNPLIVAGFANQTAPFGPPSGIIAVCDSSPSPSTVVNRQDQTGYPFAYNFLFIVPPGGYYEIETPDGGGGSDASWQGWTEWNINKGSVGFSGNLSGLRTMGSVYQNTTGSALLICAVLLSPSGNTELITGYSDTSSSPSTITMQMSTMANTTGYTTVWMMVPNGHYYEFTGTVTVSFWNEYTLPFQATKSSNLGASPTQRTNVLSSGVQAYRAATDLFVTSNLEINTSTTILFGSGSGIPPNQPFQQAGWAIGADEQPGGAYGSLPGIVLMGEYYQVSSTSNVGLPTLNSWWEYVLEE